MDLKLLQIWGDEKRQLSFVCRKCAFNDSGIYNFKDALKRLNSASTCSREELMSVMESEKLLLETYNVHLPSTDSPPSFLGLPDDVSVGILKRYQPALLSEYTPLDVDTDGNCFYRSVSRALFGTESSHHHIRLLAALEMVEHRQFYDCDSADYRDLVAELELVSDSYPELVHSVTTPSSYAEILHIFAVSAALGLPMQSYCPPARSDTFRSGPLTRRIYGRGVRPATIPRVVVMWTAAKMPKQSAPFRPNHFVPLQARHKDSTTIDLTTSPGARASLLAKVHHSTPSDKSCLQKLAADSCIITVA